MKEYSDSPCTTFATLSDIEWCPEADDLPLLINPVDLPLARQMYLYEQIREFCREGTESSVERVQRISSALDHLHYVNTTHLMFPPRMLTGMMLHHALSECVGVRIKGTQEETARRISLQRGQKPLVQ